jgi:hypothetical protein
VGFPAGLFRAANRPQNPVKTNPSKSRDSQHTKFRFVIIFNILNPFPQISQADHCQANYFIFFAGFPLAPAARSPIEQALSGAHQRPRAFTKEPISRPSGRA